MTSYKTATELITKGHSLPYGYDTLGWKVVQADMTSYNGFKWPGPGHTVATAYAVKGNVCPTVSTGGLMLAHNFEGARSGGHGNRLILVLAYNKSDILGDSDSKRRVAKVEVVAIVNPEKLFKNAAGYDLTQGAFSRMNLSGANFAGSLLYGANFRGSNIERASFEGADLSSATLSHASVDSAAFGGANLLGASLTHATGHFASFNDANLSGTSFTGTDFYGASFSGADAHSSDFRRANLVNSRWDKAILDGAYFAGAVTTYADFRAVKQAKNVKNATSEITAGITAAVKAEEAAKAKRLTTEKENYLKPSDWNSFYPQYESYGMIRFEVF